VTRTILAEAGQNASPASQASVASVIRNRLAAGGYGKTPTDVVRAPNQFEPWNPGSGNDPMRFDAKSPAYQQAQALAQGVFNGTIQDQTQGGHISSRQADKPRSADPCRAGPMDLSGQDLDNVTRTILSEVGPNASPAEMSSIASTIRNRLAAGGYGKTATEVVRAPNQFMPWNAGREGAPNDPRSYQADTPAYKQAQALAQGVFNGTVQDQTGGATNYYAPKAQAQNNASDPAHNPLVPGFAKGADPLAIIGPHHFFAPNGPVTAEQIAGLGGSPSAQSPAAQGSSGPGTAPRFAGVAAGGGGRWTTPR
jgi:spore germination cell wall hydrolase CwlJ-like protein